VTDQPKRQGPRVLPIVLECPGCAHEDGALYCAHPDIVKERGRPRMRECTRRTPDWCPMLPVRKVIGMCKTCDSNDHGECQDHMSPYWCEGVPDDFGCIHWEEKQ
jgi:hypothetical protein